MVRAGVMKWGDSSNFTMSRMENRNSHCITDSLICMG